MYGGEELLWKSLKIILGSWWISQILKELEILCYGSEWKTRVIMEGICLGIWFRNWGKEEL